MPACLAAPLHARCAGAPSVPPCAPKVHAARPQEHAPGRHRAAAVRRHHHLQPDEVLRAGEFSSTLGHEPCLLLLPRPAPFPPAPAPACSARRCGRHVGFAMPLPLAERAHARSPARPACLLSLCCPAAGQARHEAWRGGPGRAGPHGGQVGRRFRLRGPPGGRQPGRPHARRHMTCTPVAWHALLKGSAQRSKAGQGKAGVSPARRCLPLPPSRRLASLLSPPSPASLSPPCPPTPHR